MLLSGYADLIECYTCSVPIADVNVCTSFTCLGMGCYNIIMDPYGQCKPSLVAQALFHKPNSFLDPRVEKGCKNSTASGCYWNKPGQEEAYGCWCFHDLCNTGIPQVPTTPYAPPTEQPLTGSADRPGIAWSLSVMVLTLSVCLVSIFICS